MKQTYYIAIRDLDGDGDYGFTEVSGYIKDYGYMNLPILGYRKSGRRTWTVTDVASGLRILDAPTLKRADDEILRRATDISNEISTSLERKVLVELLNIAKRDNRFTFSTVEIDEVANYLLVQDGDNTEKMGTDQ